MEDKVYAKKYRKGAKKVDLLGKLKQASDARHTQFLTGYTVGGGAQMESESGVPLGLVEVGGEFYVTNYFASRVAVTGFTGSENLFVGGDIGARLQTPTRLAPFVGVGAAFGVGVFDALDIALRDDSSDEFSSQGSTSEPVAIFYPETGVHFWLNGNVRVSAFGRHNFTASSLGENLEGWLVGGQVAYFRRF